MLMSIADRGEQCTMLAGAHARIPFYKHIFKLAARARPL